MTDLWQAAWFESLITVINIHIILTKVCVGVTRWRTTVAIFLCVLMPSMVWSLFPLSPLWQIAFALCMLLPFVIPLLTVSGMKKPTILYITFLYIGISGIFVFPFAIFAETLNFPKSGRILADVIANCLLLVICVLAGKRILFKTLYSDLTILEKRIKAFLIVSVWVGTSFARFFTQAFRSYPQTPLNVAAECLAYVLVILIFVMCPLLTASSVSNSYNKKLLATFDTQVKAQAAHYKMMMQVNDDTREFRHNFQNLRIGLVDFLASNDVDGALKYINELNKPIRTEVLLFETGNSVADALLYEKQIMAMENNTAIKFDGLIPNDKISPVDLCVIIGNAVDNAMEACERLTDSTPRVVTVSASFTNGFLFIGIENPVAEAVHIVNNTIATTKDDKIAHGIGLSSIRSVASKYSGKMRLSCENSVFAVEVALDLNMAGEE
ncbi:MAG: GHKL domain-containing protein [Oscillospiraceae bacterium]|jgi:sensor histidine kinase YesM|nr:GHKL domain-containing protein [Oscillospiraceae bacterium]